MKKFHGWWILLILVALGFLWGCGPSTQSGINKEYDMRMTVTEQSTVNLNIQLDADTTGATESGDADATLDVDSRLTAAWDAAQAQGVEEGVAFLKDIQNWLDKKIQTDNSDTTNPTPAPDPTPVPTPDPQPGPIPDPEPDDDVVIGDDMTFGTYKCEDLDFAYKDCDTCEKVKQLVCTFTDYDSCDQIPEESFTMVWKDADGGFKYLEVSDRCSIAMDDEEAGYGKFRPAHDKEPFKPVAYAPRYFDAVEVDLVKK